MSRFHQWKGRLQNQTEGYPFLNGPPSFDRNGDPAFPVEAGVAYAVDGFPGPIVAFNFAGTASQAQTAVWQLAYLNATLEEAVSDGSFPITVGMTAEDVADAFLISLEIDVLPTDIVVTVSGTVVTLTCVELGQVINGYYLNYAA